MSCVMVFPLAAKPCAHRAAIRAQKRPKIVSTAKALLDGPDIAYLRFSAAPDNYNMRQFVGHWPDPLAAAWRIEKGSFYV